MSETIEFTAGNGETEISAEAGVQRGMTPVSTDEMLQTYCSEGVVPEAV
ncbi:MAG: hypothetical protein ACRBCJ_06050 [Hyphomicrobiaceae bacterium]